MPKKIVLAYSGGLDTSVILKWLQNTYNCPVVTFTADISGDNVRLRGTVAGAEDHTIKIVKRSVNI